MKALMVIDVQNGMFLEEDPVFEGDRTGCSELSMVYLRRRGR